MKIEQVASGQSKTTNENVLILFKISQFWFPAKLWMVWGHLNY